MRPRSHGAGCAALAMLLLLALLLGRAGAQQPEAAPVYPTAPGPDISWGDEYRETTLSQPSVAQPGAPAPTRASEAVTETAPFSGVTDAEETFAMKPDKFALPEIPLAFSMAATTETSPPQGTPLAVSGFVGRNGTNFVVNGKVHFFPGSNDYFLLLRNYITNKEIGLFFKRLASNGIELVRTWAFLNGDQDPVTLNGTLSIQPKIGVYNEKVLQRLDLIVAEAGSNGVRVMFPFVNFRNDMGGMRWYVDQVLGPEYDVEEFYFNPAVLVVFKKYVTMILTRVNTITGVQYSQDPTIFALELANEPHTTDGYEAARGIPVGSIVKEWIMEMVATIRLVDSNHMLSTGEEGWLANGATSSSWMTDGAKGTNWAGNLELVDFATVHLYPGNWGVPPYAAADFASSFVYERAQIARAQNKPFILEETGKEMSYPIPRTEYLSAMFEAGLQAGAAAIMPWELVAWHVQPNASTGFDFGVDDSSFGPVTQMVEELYHRTQDCASGTCPALAPPCQCFDIPPTGSTLTCVQQVATNNCTETWLGPGICDLSCGRCTPCKKHDYCNYCFDSPPDWNYTCTQQLAFHPDPCSLPYMQKGTCDVTCNRCKPCPDPGGPNYCQANVQVGPFWNISATQMGARQNIILSSPGPQAIPVPYNLTLTGQGTYDTQQTWEWNSTAAAPVIAGNQVTGTVTNPNNMLLPNSTNSATIGSLLTTGTRTAVFPTSVEVNGVSCGLVVSAYKAPDVALQRAASTLAAAAPAHPEAQQQ